MKNHSFLPRRRGKSKGKKSVVENRKGGKAMSCGVKEGGKNVGGHRRN